MKNKISGGFCRIVRSSAWPFVLAWAWVIGITIYPGTFGGTWPVAGYFDRRNGNRDGGLCGRDKLDAVCNAYRRCKKKRSSD